MDQSLLIFTQIPLQTMLCNLDGAMLSRLLGLLVLTSLCSAMLRRRPPKMSESSEEYGSASDPNTYHWPGSDEKGSSESSEEGSRWSPVSRSGPLPLPPEQPWPPIGNLTNNHIQPRMYPDPDSMVLPTPDTAICDLLLNAAAPPPMDQIPFFCICSRCKGTVGPKGDRGDRGLPGEPGSPGRRGLMGFKGRTGYMGPQGIKGQKGDMGQEGQVGPSGLPGMKGERGMKGEKGDSGMMGPPGTQGPQGETGTCPASCDSVQGPPGVQGIPGPAGARGLPGVKGDGGSEGLKGQKGDMGRAGVPGINGPKGDQGEQGVCECTDGMDGAEGSQGEKGAKGDKGDTGVQGVQGSTGPQGDQGMIGPIGPPGPCSPAIQSAFCAQMNESFPEKDMPIPFRLVLTNMQGHFNPAGIYTAPVNGTYVFSYFLSVAYKPLKVGIFLNLYPVVRTTEGQDKSTASQSIVLHLSMGDQVWLQVKNNDTNGIFINNERSSTFSGYLLYPDSCDFPLGRHHYIHMTMFKRGDFGWDGPPGTPTPLP